MARDTSELTDEQWEKIAPLLPAPQASPWGGRKPTPHRPCFEGILWILRTGARWKALPKQYPSPSPCWRRLRDWAEHDVWLKAWRAFLGHLDAQGQLVWSAAFADGSCAPAKKRAYVGKTKRGKGTKWMVVVEGQGGPLGHRLDAASTAAVTLVEPTLETSAVPRGGRGRPRKRPARLIYDKACTSESLRRRLAQCGITGFVRIARIEHSHRGKMGASGGAINAGGKSSTRSAGLGNFRRLVVRWGRHITMYSTFFHVACLLITLRQL